MAGLDTETLDLILSTLKKYADKKLTLDYLLALDHNDEFPHEVLKELYDPNTLGLHLVFIPEEYGGLGGGAYDIYRVAELMGEDAREIRAGGVVAPDRRAVEERRDLLCEVLDRHVRHGLPQQNLTGRSS